MNNIAYNDNCNFLTSFVINDEWFRLMSRLLCLPRSICMPLLSYNMFNTIMIFRPVIMQMPKVIVVSNNTDRS